MNNQLKQQIIDWVKKELNDYIKECGPNEYRFYIRSDAETRFGGDDQILQNEVSELVSHIINGD